MSRNATIMPLALLAIPGCSSGVDTPALPMPTDYTPTPDAEVLASAQPLSQDTGPVMPTWATVFLAGLSLFFIVMVFVIEMIRRRYQRLAAFDGSRRRSDLRFAAELANSYAERGFEHPGTMAVLNLYPTFDFTLGGLVSDLPIPPRPPDNLAYAPFSPAQVSNLHHWQTESGKTPVRCGNDGCDDVLTATPEGWQCPADGCGYTQTWAYRIATDGKWQPAMRMDDNGKLWPLKGVWVQHSDDDQKDGT